MTTKRLWVGLSMLLVAAGTATGYFAGRARAAGIPAMGPLSYGGVLTDAAGTPLTGSKNIQVVLWDDATAGTQQCSMTPSAQTLVGGAFRVTLPDTWHLRGLPNKGHGRYRLAFTLPGAPTGPWALRVDRVSASKVVRLNGRVLVDHAMPESLARYTSALADDVTVYPGHGPSTSIGIEKRTNPFLLGVARLIRR